MIDSANLLKAVITSARGISQDLYNGDDKSKRMGRILEISINVLDKSEARFDRMWGDLEDVYSEMKKTHDKIYVELGGVLGSGSFFEVEADELSKKTGLNTEKIYGGLDPEGFNGLQASIVAIKKLKNILQDASPLPVTNSRDFDRIENIYWLTLMSVYESKHRDKVLKIINRYDPKSS